MPAASAPPYGYVVYELPDPEPSYEQMLAALKRVPGLSRASMSICHPPLARPGAVAEGWVESIVEAHRLDPGENYEHEQALDELREQAEAAILRLLEWPHRRAAPVVWTIRAPAGGGEPWTTSGSLAEALADREHPPEHADELSALRDARAGLRGIDLALLDRVTFKRDGTRTTIAASRRDELQRALEVLGIPWTT